MLVKDVIKMPQGHQGQPLDRKLTSEHGLRMVQIQDLAHKR